MLLYYLFEQDYYVLIYYSGHGKIKATQAYWIPKDGSYEWGESWINVNELNIFLTEIKAHHLAVMVDSCYVGGKFKGSNILDMTNDDDRSLFKLQISFFCEIVSSFETQRK